jgi:hypothetical protein
MEAQPLMAASWASYLGAHPGKRIDVLLDEVEVVRATVRGGGATARLEEVPESASHAYRDVVAIDVEMPRLDPHRGAILFRASRLARESGYGTTVVLALARPGPAREGWLAALAGAGLIAKPTIQRGPYTRFLIATPPRVGCREVASRLDKVAWRTSTGWLGGRLLAAAGLFQEALLHLDREQRLGEDPLATRIERSRCLCALGRSDEGIALLEREASAWASPPDMLVAALEGARLRARVA